MPASSIFRQFARATLPVSLPVLLFVSWTGPILARAGGPSAALWGKSIVMNWTEVTQNYRERNPRKGNYFGKTETGSARVYISERGRLFGEGMMSGGAGRRHLGHVPSEQSPDDGGDDAASSDWHWSASGTSVSATRLFTQGATRISATVEPQADPATCQLHVIFGKENGAFERTGGRRHAPETVLSSEIQDATCQLVNGNVFAP